MPQLKSSAETHTQKKKTRFFFFIIKELDIMENLSVKVLVKNGALVKNGDLCQKWLRNFLYL